VEDAHCRTQAAGFFTLARRRQGPRGVYANRTRLGSEVGKQAMRRRAEIVERSFAHNLDRGGMRRTWLRGRENVPQALPGSCRRPQSRHPDAAADRGRNPERGGCPAAGLSVLCYTEDAAAITLVVASPDGIRHFIAVTVGCLPDQNVTSATGCYVVDLAGTVAAAWAHLDVHSYALVIADCEIAEMGTVQPSQLRRCAVRRKNLSMSGYLHQMPGWQGRRPRKHYETDHANRACRSGFGEPVATR